MSDGIQNVEQYYDEVPYDSYMFPQTAPEHLAAVAYLFGLAAPAVATARVLELGCSSAGNLIPFAVRYPQARLVGIDLSPVQIDLGKRKLEQMGLDNVELIAGDLSAMGAELGEFDYIICHGVYSWVPESVREAILRISRDNLAPEGIAYISYNTYPGWKGRELVRDAMCLRANQSPADRLGRARGMIDFLHQHVDAGSVLGRALQEYQQQSGNYSDYYLLHEYLEPFNAPCYFSDFVRLAEEQGLGYLADATPATMFLGNYAPAAQGPLLAECGSSQVLLESYLDFLTNRAFRQSLLVRQERVGDIRYQLQSDRLRTLHLAAYLPCLSGEPRFDPSEQSFGAASGRSLVLKGREVKCAAVVLTEAWPNTLGMDELLAAVGKQLGSLSARAEHHLTVLFEQLVISGMARVRLEPVVARNAPVAKPCIAPALLAYVHSLPEGHSPHIFNAWHEPVGLDVVASHLLPLLDGSRTRADLLKCLEEAGQKGLLGFLRNGERLTAKDDLHRAMEEHLERVLHLFGLATA
ncbi:hypothetical protein D3C76_516550 [compost metagenome]